MFSGIFELFYTFFKGVFLMFLESLLHAEQSLVFVMFAAYIAGVLASFTPCIYPMIPITLGIVTSQRSTSMLNNFLLSLSYGIGIAVVYASLGYLSAKSSVMFGQWLASPYFIVAMIALFVYLAFAMFGFYEMYVPRFLASKSTSSYKGGSVTYSFLFGVLSGAAASPCLTPALAMLLGYAAKQGSPLVGFFVLFAFAMGISTLLIVVGTFSSALSLLPRAGMWMVEVKKIFGFLLLGVCINFAAPLLAPLTITSLFAALLLIAGLYYVSRSKQGSRFSIPFLLLGLLLSGSALLTFINARLAQKGSSVQEWVHEIFSPKKPE